MPERMSAKVIFAGGSESGLVANSLLRGNASTRKPIVVKIAPPIISQCGNSIDESRPIYFPFAFGSRIRAERRWGRSVRRKSERPLPTASVALPRIDSAPVGSKNRKKKVGWLQ
jgi:hypothetical protein